MNWRSYPDPLFVPDSESAFLLSPGRRRMLVFLELVRFLASTVLLVGFVFLLIIGVMFGLPNWLWGLIGILAFTGFALFFSGLPLLRRVPLRCSRCSLFMERRCLNHQNGGSPLFYVCPRCLRYVDSGVSYGD